MDYRFKQVTNGYFDIKTSDKMLTQAWGDNCYRYDYVLGDNELTLSLLEYENSRYLEHFKNYFNKPLTITLEALEPSARNRFHEAMQRYYSLTFNACKMVRYTNNGHVDRVSHSTVKITFSFEDFDVEYH
ncbi:MAG: hypothetical protein HQL54_04245 [Magnetococcales bacterium]|nr:hypothetical protein [Magnetococcales bacterium]